MTKKSDSEQKWEKRVSDLAPRTIRNYQQSVKLYEEFHDMKMDELIAEALEEQSSRTAEHELKIYDRIVDFRSDLIKEGRKITGVAAYITKIKTLYRKSRVRIPYIPPLNEINANRSEVIKFEDYLTKEELKKGIEYLPLIMRGRMLAMTTGGLSNDECASLETKKHFIDPLYQYHRCDDDIEALRYLANSDNIIWIICIKRGKTGKPFYAIMNPECVKITAMAKLEEVKALPFGKLPRELNKKLYPTTKNYFAELCRRINDGLDFGYVGQKEHEAQTDENGQFTVSNLDLNNLHVFLMDGTRIYRESLKIEKDKKTATITIRDSNLQPVPNTPIKYKCGGKSRFRPHMFRKFHATAVRGNYHIDDDRLSPIEIDELQGRGMTSVQETYIKSNPIHQKFLYARIINNVSLWHRYEYAVIGDDVHLRVVDDELKSKELEKENEKLQKKLELNRDVREDIKDLISDKGIDEVADIVSKLLKAS